MADETRRFAGFLARQLVRTFVDIESGRNAEGKGFWQRTNEALAAISLGDDPAPQLKALLELVDALEGGERRFCLTPEAETTGEKLEDYVTAAYFQLDGFTLYLRGAA